MNPIDAFDAAQQWLFEQAVQPAMFALGLGGILEDGFRATGWLLIGALQIVAMVTVIAALQRWRPVEPVTDRATVRTDVVYTLLHRLGVVRVAFFFLLDPVVQAIAAQGRLAGWHGWQLDQLWPGVTDQALVSFALYLLVFDAIDWAIHRAQHRFGWWWQLHALHHAQRQMTMWSDNRNHLLDDALRDAILALSALVLGVSPGQFIAVVAVTQLVESLSHANLRLSFGRVGERLLVSPRFHRQHHEIGDAERRNCNYAVLFPVWDVLAGSARFDGGTAPTGVRDQLPEHGAREYGRGFWHQQWLGLRRLAGRA